MRPVKRRRISSEDGDDVPIDPSSTKTTSLDSLYRGVSPPQLSKHRASREIVTSEGKARPSRSSEQPDVVSTSHEVNANNIEPCQSSQKSEHSPRQKQFKTARISGGVPTRPMPKSAHRSPFKLTRIRDLPAECNIDTIGVNDLLGDPLIKEAWLFDYLFDIDWLMQAFDPDVRSLVQVKIIHGSWRQDDAHRFSLIEAAKSHANIQLIAAHMPEAFGTHHSKMMILFRHDDTAEVIIHTANMIRQDWTNMTQGVWTSERLPLLRTKTGHEASDDDAAADAPMGSSKKFKSDLLNYLSAYEGRTKSLRTQLQQYDFSSVRAALIASVPGKQTLFRGKCHGTSWGWPALSEHLSKILCPSPVRDYTQAAIVAQVSSIATLSEKWIQHFTSVLETSLEDKVRTGPALLPSGVKMSKEKFPAVKIVFPTTEEVRVSLDGYASGGSIHLKVQSAAQQKQMSILRPMFHRWNNWPPEVVGRGLMELSTAVALREDGGLRAAPYREEGDALRVSAAPHIKTYIRYRDQMYKDIQWALLTSANLSTQAWGALPSSSDAKSARKGNEAQQVRICSYEIGVLIWPALFQTQGDDGADQRDIVMRPTFGRDTLDDDQDHGREDVVVPVRMPYSLPITPYRQGDGPWCATLPHSTPDIHGYTSMP